MARPGLALAGSELVLEGLVGLVGSVGLAGLVWMDTRRRLHPRKPGTLSHHQGRFVLGSLSDRSRQRT